MTGFIDPIQGRPAVEFTEAQRQAQIEFTNSHYRGILPGEVVIMIREQRTIPRPPLMTRDGLLTPQSDICAGNSALLFPPIARALRSAFDDRLSGIGPQDLQHQLRMAPGPIVPGERIHLDRERRIGRVTDALGDRTPTGERWRKFLADLPFKVERLHGCPLGHPLPDESHDLRDESALVTWEFWMAKFYEGNLSGPVKQTCCELLQGTLAKSEDLAKSSLVKIYKAHPAGGILEKRNFYPPNGIAEPTGELLTDREGRMLEQLLAAER